MALARSALRVCHRRRLSPSKPSPRPLPPSQLPLSPLAPRRPLLSLRLRSPMLRRLPSSPIPSSPPMRLGPRRRCLPPGLLLVSRPALALGCHLRCRPCCRRRRLCRRRPTRCRCLVHFCRHRPWTRPLRWYLLRCPDVKVVALDQRLRPTARGCLPACRQLRRSA